MKRLLTIPKVGAKLQKLVRAGDNPSVDMEIFAKIYPKVESLNVSFQLEDD